MAKSAELIETYLDGLQALTDGRGWGIKHQEASDEIHRLIDTHDDLLTAAKYAVKDDCEGIRLRVSTVGSLRRAIKEAEGRK